MVCHKHTIFRSSRSTVWPQRVAYCQTGSSQSRRKTGVHKADETVVFLPRLETFTDHTTGENATVHSDIRVEMCNVNLRSQR